MTDPPQFYAEDVEVLRRIQTADGPGTEVVARRNSPADADAEADRLNRKWPDPRGPSPTPSEPPR